ncbi:hypothetical protein Tsubulata_004567 [Turnera subulata]|uniref:WW domain-containing protein n=1 Tax=Turnera subulata TaxID=218843 RepID=A0A9Q0FVX6_9ROSI|nr:hypothetical protein Tsubulata_004567 [Turnera subulata]
MTAPNMAAITASLERSLQNCSLNHHHHHHQSSSSGGHVLLGGGGGGGERSSSSSSSSSDEADAPVSADHLLPNPDASLELNSHLSLPYHWEQCLDLKTGEIYYINWRNGMRAKEDPRLSQDYNGGYFSEDDDSSYDSEESSSESSPSSTTRDHCRVEKEDHVLVVGGCKSCLMYFMVPKQVYDCPKCNGQLLHFDRSENGSP